MHVLKVCFREKAGLQKTSRTNNSDPLRSVRANQNSEVPSSTIKQ